MHLKAEAQAGILYQVYIDLLGDGLQLVSIQVGQRNLLHLNRQATVRRALALLTAHSGSGAAVAVAADAAVVAVADRKSVV